MINFPCCGGTTWHAPKCPYRRRNVLVDIDHVISNAFPRDPMIGNASWDDYHSASVSDDPLHDLVGLINALHAFGYYIIMLTARPSRYRKITMEWLVRHGVKVDEMLMRDDDLFRPSPEMKLALVKARFADMKDEVAFMLDDRDDVCAAFREEGITVLQVFGRRA